MNIQEKVNIDRNLSVALEETEAVYWSKYYSSNEGLSSFGSIISGAFAGSVPDLDILAMNRVIGLGINNIVDSDGLESIIHFYKETGAKRFFVQLSDYTIQDNLRLLLDEAGFRLHNRWAKLIKKLEGNPVSRSSDLEIRKITGDHDQVEAYGQILFDCFDWEDPRLKDWLRKIIGKSGYHNYLAYQDETPVAAAALHLMGKYASLAFAGTLPAFRGLGAQHKLIETRLREAYNSGCEYVFSETAVSTAEQPVQSYLNMIDCGFEEVYKRENWLMEL